MSKSKSAEFNYENGVITLPPAMQRRVERAAKKVHADAHGFLEEVLTCAVQSVLEAKD